MSERLKLTLQFWWLIVRACGLIVATVLCLPLAVVVPGFGQGMVRIAMGLHAEQQRLARAVAALDRSAA